MPALFAADALLASGWARDVVLEWDDAGVFTRVEAAAVAHGAIAHASGPVIPGMCNVHSHAFQRAMAGLAEVRGHPTDDFWTWREEMYRLVARIEPGEHEAIARHLYIEMLKQGYTTVVEFHYLHNDRDGRRYSDAAEMAHRVVHAAHAAGIALTCLPVLYAHGGFGHRVLSPAQKRFASDAAFIVELVRSLAGFHLPDRLLRLGVAPHSARAVDALALTELVDATTRLDPTMPIHMHVSEQTREVEECVAAHGVTPLAWVLDLVPVDPRWCMIHATHLTQLEARHLAGTGACIGVCPSTEANLGDGIFELAPWREAKAPWAIGGDSHVCVSPFEELRALETSQRLRYRVRNVAADETEPDVASNLWREAARGGARASGHPADELAPGRRADFVVLDRAAPALEALAAPAILSTAIFGGNPGPVRDVFVAGDPVVEGGRHAGEEEAAADYRAALRSLRAR